MYRNAGDETDALDCLDWSAARDPLYRFGRCAAQRRATTTVGDWPMYRHDLAGTGYSPLTQITTTNVATLTQAWTYRPARRRARTRPPADAAARAASNSEATPIVVNGVMYLPAANRVVALEPETGKEIWQHPVTGGAPSRRGVAYWPGEGSTRAAHLLHRRPPADRARRRDRRGRRRASARTAKSTSVVPYNSVPLVYQNVVVVGANTPPGAIGGIGNPRARSTRAPAPSSGSSARCRSPATVGHDTWEGDSWKGRLGANAWPFYFTLDEARGLLYLPLASPIPGAYGGDRKGANLFGNSVVAVDVADRASTTGTSRPSITISGIADPPAPPGLFDIVRNGRTIPALGADDEVRLSVHPESRNRRSRSSASKSGRCRRATCPASWRFRRSRSRSSRRRSRASRTRRRISSPRRTRRPSTPRPARSWSRRIGGVFNAGPFTPWLYRAEGAPPKSTLVFPGGLGGANWGGTAFDPRIALRLRRSRRTSARSAGSRRPRTARRCPTTRATGSAAARSTSAMRRQRTGRARNRHGDG